MERYLVVDPKRKKFNTDRNTMSTNENKERK